MTLAVAALAVGCRSGHNAQPDATVRNAESTDRFVARLLANGTRELDDSGCLASADEPVTIAREFVAIIGRLALDDLAARVNSECSAETDGSGYHSCTLSLFSADEKIERSMGFSFAGKPETGDILLESVGCIQTP